MARETKYELIPYEDAFAHDNVTPLCVELTEQQIVLLLSQTTYLYWAKRYLTHNGLPLTAEQREVIEKSAAAIEAVLVNAQGCDMGYTIELVGCNLNLMNNGVMVSTVDLSACISPPIHLGFDVPNCRLMYTQGDLNSPYVGGDWITVIDWNIENFRECLTPSQQPPKPELITAEICDIAWGTAEQVLRDVLYIQQYVFDALSGAPYVWAIDLLADASFLARQWWGTIGDIASAIGLAEWISLAPVPDQPMLDTYASLEAKTLLATYFYCSMSLDANGNIYFDGAEWQSRMDAGFFSVNVRDAVLSYVQANGSGDLLRNYFLFAAVNTTGTDCSTLDCYALPSCGDYFDDMLGGLGAQTRLFDSAHDYAATGGVASTVTPNGGIGGGYRVECDYELANFVGGFFVDLGRECTVESATVWHREQFDSTNYPFAVDIDFYGSANELRYHYHDPVNYPDASIEWRNTGHGSPVGNVRYIAFIGGSSKYNGALGVMYLCNPAVITS